MMEHTVGKLISPLISRNPVTMSDSDLNYCESWFIFGGQIAGESVTKEMAQLVSIGTVRGNKVNTINRN